MAAPRKPGNRWSDKEWREAIRLAVNETGADGTKKLRRLATVVVDAALDAQPWAVAEVGNRLDGRPAQDLNIQQNITHELASVSDTDIARELIRRGTEIAGAEPVREGELH